MSIFVDIEKNLGSFSMKTSFRCEDETIALLGASGCGKSLTLRCIAGIEKPDRGRIEVDGITYFDSEKGIDLAPQERRTGLLFQNYALFPNMTVLQNIRCGAKREKDKSKRENMIRYVIESFGLSDQCGKYPHQLSGGQQQRTALARILVSAPRILLLDEPFSALDVHLRFQMEQEVRNVIREFGKTVILVSHDRDEVFRMADKIALMENGRITVCGEKKEVFFSPKTKQGAMLTGCKNISAAEILSDGRVFAKDWGLTLTVSSSVKDVKWVGIRMHDVLPDGGCNTVTCQVAQIIENPFSFVLMLRLPNGISLLGWEREKHKWAREKVDTVTVSLPPEKLLLLRD